MWHWQWQWQRWHYWQNCKHWTTIYTTDHLYLHSTHYTGTQCVMTEATHIAKNSNIPSISMLFFNHITAGGKNIITSTWTLWTKDSPHWLTWLLKKCACFYIHCQMEHLLKNTLKDNTRTVLHGRMHFVQSVTTGECLRKGSHKRLETVGYKSQRSAHPNVLYSTLP